MQFFIFNNIKISSIVHIVFIGLIAIICCFFGIAYFSYEDSLKKSIYLEVEARNTKIISNISLNAQKIASQDATSHQQLSSNTKSLLDNLKCLKEGCTLDQSKQAIASDKAHEALLSYMIELTEQIRTENYLLYGISFRTDSLGNEHPNTDIDRTEQNRLLQKIAENLKNLRIFNKQLEDAYQEDETLQRSYKRTGIVLFFIISLIFVLLTYQWAFSTFLKIIGQIVRSSQNLVDGDLDILIEDSTEDEIGQIIRNINQVTKQLNGATNFANEIGKSKFDTKFEASNERDQLGKALLEMRNNLKNADEMRKTRRWYNQGISLFNNLLKDISDDQAEFGYQVISTLVKFLNANQGRFYILEQEDNQEILHLISGYAYDKRKYLTQKVPITSGTLGQVVYDGKIIVTKDIPQEYITITSGLGHATPSHLMTVPLVNDETVFGVLEIASFRDFTDNETKLTQDISESIASVLANVRKNQHMKKLLENAESYSKQVTDQEAVMKLALNDFDAKQKENQIKLTEAENKLALLEKILSSTHCFIFVINENYFIEYMNQTLYQAYKKHGIELKINMYAPGLFTSMEQFTQTKCCERAFQGELVSEVHEMHIAEKELRYMENTYIKMDENHVLVVGYDITHLDLKQESL